LISATYIYDLLIMPDVSALGPIDPASVPVGEEEKAAPWIVRKVVGVSLD